MEGHTIHSHQEVNRVCNRAEVHVKLSAMLVARPKVSQQNVAPSVTPPPSVTPQPAASSLIYLLLTCFDRYKVM